MENNRDIPVISFVANSSSGKTTLLEKVVYRLKAEGFRVAVIKHTSHRFDLDQPGKDSWRMSQAGADIIAISSPDKLAIIEKVSEEKSLDDVLGMISNVDLILTEGFKRGGKPAIEVSRSEAGSELIPGLSNRLAIASDVQWDIGVPCCHIDDVDGIVTEIKKYAVQFKADGGQRPPD